jgi:hypothetical protein
VTLDELAGCHGFAVPLAVPEWTLGCFHRRSIAFATGQEDASTRVIWLQSHGMTADIRIPATRPDLSGKFSLSDCTSEELAALAVSDGFIARTSWSDGQMRWDAFAGFQPYNKWPEPGRLERVGPCLIEWPPSLVYVEDWRLQPGSEGLSVGLRLLSETGLDGIERPRQGGLVIAGDHALLVIDRREPLPKGRVQEMIEAAADPQALARQAFDAQVAYGRRQAETYETVLAVDPFAEGQFLFAPDSFAVSSLQTLVQTGDGSEGWRKRLWAIDTLLRDQSRPAATPASAEGRAWLTAEAATLLPSAVPWDRFRRP